MAALADDDDDAKLRPLEPDYTLVNLPTTLPLPRHAGNFHLTHRFNENLARGQLRDAAVESVRPRRGRHDRLRISLRPLQARGADRLADQRRSHHLARHQDRRVPADRFDAARHLRSRQRRGRQQFQRALRAGVRRGGVAHGGVEAGVVRDADLRPQHAAGRRGRAEHLLRRHRHARPHPAVTLHRGGRVAAGRPATRPATPSSRSRSRRASAPTSLRLRSPTRPRSPTGSSPAAAIPTVCISGSISPASSSDRRRLPMKSMSVLAVVFALCAAGCGSSSSSTSPTNGAPTFTATLSARK